MELKEKKVLLTGASGFLGGFVLAALLKQGLNPADIFCPQHSELDYKKWKDCCRAVEDIDIVIHLAAQVGGIGFNRRNQGIIFYENIIMGIQLMEAARQAGVSKFLQVGTVCAYPKITPVPFREESLWEGYPEETNAPYGIAKKALLVQAQAYRAQYGFNAIYLLPTNLYGPRDSFDPEDSHVIPALIRKCIDAVRTGKKEIEVWGSGSASREFLYVEDCAEGIFLAAQGYDNPAPVNLGSGIEISIRNLVELIAEECGFQGSIRWDATKPDGQPRRCLDTTRAQQFGFKARTQFREGLRKTISWYCQNY